MLTELVSHSVTGASYLIITDSDTLLGNGTQRVVR